jgi:hypothetical protein
MDFLVFVDAEAGELEKILSGVKCMLAKELDPEQPEQDLMQPGDSLYFLRDNGEREVRVRASVAQALRFTGGPQEDLVHMLKELQPRLQLTEQQYNKWIGKQRALFIEFKDAQKIEEWQSPAETAAQRAEWIRLEERHATEQDAAGLKRE